MHHILNKNHIKTSMKHIHTTIVNKYVNSKKNTQLANTLPPKICRTERTFPGATHHILSQCRTNKFPTLHSYLKKTDADINPSPLYPLCKTETPHIIVKCTKIIPLGCWVDNNDRVDALTCLVLIDPP